MSNVIQQIFIDKIVNYMDELIFKGKVKMNGEYKDYTIFKTIKEGNRLRKYLYVETEMGSVEEAQLLSSMGEVLAIKPFSITKEEDGLVLAFEFTLTLEERG